MVWERNSEGILTNTDELLTAERSREMLLTTPWWFISIFKGRSQTAAAILADDV